jgi:TolB-like protein
MTLELKEDPTVMPYQSVSRYATREIKRQNVAQELHVQYVVTGTLRVEAKNVRVVVQLFDAAKDKMVLESPADQLVELSADWQETVARQVMDVVHQLAKNLGQTQISCFTNFRLLF